MTTEQKLARALDGLSHVLESAKCVETRRFVAKLLRGLDAEASAAPALGFRVHERPREHVPTTTEIMRSYSHVTIDGCEIDPWAVVA